MIPLLLLLERLWGPLGESLTALGASWGALGRVLGALRELLGTSSAQETLYFLKMSVSPRWEHVMMMLMFDNKLRYQTLMGGDDEDAYVGYLVARRSFSGPPWGPPWGQQTLFSCSFCET